MTTPDRRILALTSVLLLLLQALPASAFCHCETPCGPAAEPVETPGAVDSCCSQESVETLPAFEGVCCMAGGSEFEFASAVAIAHPTGLAHDPPAVREAIGPIASRLATVETRARLLPRSAPPSPPPIFLLTVSFLN